MNLNQVTLPVCDLDESVAFYEALGFRKIVANEGYARFECTVGDSTFSLEKVDRLPTTPGAVIYFEVSDLRATCDLLLSRGILFEQGPKDEAWLWSEARLKDPSGNELCIYHAGANRKYPPWRI